MGRPFGFYGPQGQVPPQGPAGPPANAQQPGANQGDKDAPIPLPPPTPLPKSGGQAWNGYGYPPPAAGQTGYHPGYHPGYPYGAYPMPAPYPIYNWNYYYPVNYPPAGPNFNIRGY